MFTKKDIYFSLIQFFADDKPHSKAEVYQYIESQFKLSEQDKNLKTSSGSLIYKTRISWAIKDLCVFDEISLLKNVARGEYQATERGLKVATDKRLCDAWYANFLKLYSKNGKENKLSTNKSESIINSKHLESEFTPEESFDHKIKEVNLDLRERLLVEIRNKNFYFFENLVLQLLEKMGYGNVTLTQRGADEGIDGIISEDELGLSKIYVQAKRWESPVSRPEVQKFVGAISDKPTQKGVFITTSRFSREAEQYAKNIQNLTVVLIDGDKLCELMIKHKVGVYVKQTIELCDIDKDFFDDESF